MNEKIADCLGKDIIFKENTHAKVRAGTVRAITPSGKYVCIEESNEDSCFDVGTISVLEVPPELNQKVKTSSGAEVAVVPLDPNGVIPEIPTAGDPTAGQATTTSGSDTTSDPPLETT